MDTSGHIRQPGHTANNLDHETSSALTSAVPWVWICAIPFILGGILALIFAGLGLLAAFKLGGGMILMAGIQLIQAIIVLYLGVSLIRFATNVSNYKNGNSSALQPAFSSLAGYFRVTGLLILLTVGLVILVLVLGVGAGMMGGGGF